jgi:hypothetical protein
MGTLRPLDAKHDRAASWYERFGALRLLDDPHKLILPLSTIAGAIAAAERKILDSRLRGNDAGTTQPSA